MTQIFSIFNVSRTVVRLVIVLSLSVAVSACGSKKTVVTVDDSADYKSARALPPLKKPNRDQTPSPAPVAPAASNDVVIQAETIETVDEEVAASSSEAFNQEEVIQETAEVTTTDTAELETTVEESFEATEVEGDAGDAYETAAEESVVSATQTQISAAVRNVDGYSRLAIQADFESAWDYLMTHLVKSDVTIFSRNKEAGRFAIGCSDVEVPTEPAVVKKGGWSFFKRGSQEKLEYCALQTLFKNGETSVSVLNRGGQEVGAEYSARVFERILNN